MTNYDNFVPIKIQGNTLSSKSKASFKFGVHENTIQTILQKAAYHQSVARHCPYLNKHDRVWRLKFAKEHKNWTVEDRGKVLFSDEMAVKLLWKDMLEIMYGESRCEKFHPDCINYWMSSKGEELMFWGVVRRGKMGPSGFFSLEDGKTIDSAIYWDQILLKSLQQILGEAFEVLMYQLLWRIMHFCIKRYAFPFVKSLECRSCTGHLIPLS